MTKLRILICVDDAHCLNYDVPIVVNVDGVSISILVNLMLFKNDSFSIDVIDDGIVISLISPMFS